MALFVCIALVSVAVFARDLSAIARRERMRRQSVHSSGDSAGSRTFTNEDLETYGETATPSSPEARPTPRRAAANNTRDLRKEESYWRKEKLRHDRELARLDASIRRLEWRLNERRLQSREKSRVREDPGVTLIEESLESLQEERERLDREFRDRARKAGAFPGWLR